MSKRPFETEEEGEEQKRGTQKIMIRVTSSSVFFTRPEIGSMIKSKQHPLTVRHFGCGSCGGGGGSTSCCCQVDECERDLSGAKQYYKRHRVCEQHAKAAVVFSKGTLQRFCQQCSKFHALSEFDDGKRSCRERLASHNERRRLRSAVQEVRAKGVDGGGGGGTKLITEKTCKKLL